MSYRRLNAEERDRLTAQGCTASDWAAVTVAEGCPLDRLRTTAFHGTVRIGTLDGTADVGGVQLPCGIYNATISNAEIGDRVRIASVRSALHNVVVESGAVVEDVASFVCAENAAFGNGTVVETINEAGGRTVTLCNELSAQTAYLQSVLRHDTVFTEKLDALLAAEAGRARTPKGIIGAGARVLHCGPIVDVCVGPFAKVHGVASLTDGTILSCSEHPTEVGDGVNAHHFLIAEGAKITDGAILDKVFVGQAVKMGKGYSAENCVFFANCELFHGEAVALFGGPYTVTHHKSTLLIAGLFSFYNAGSGTNQSNHMYKLGPVHQGILERGCKTGSFSYLLHESHIGAFSVVIGKHLANISIPDLPFSYITDDGGSSKVTPGINLFAVGTVRDGEKWPKRDGRKAPVKRDRIVFDVFSPYTVEKMRRGRKELLRLSEITPKEKAMVMYGGANISRLLLRKSAKYYQTAITRYLNETICSRVAEGLSSGKNFEQAIKALTPESLLVNPFAWTDLAGLLVPTERLYSIINDIKTGAITSYAGLTQRLDAMLNGYAADVWSYVCAAYKEETGQDITTLTRDRVMMMADEWLAAAQSLHSMILDDSKKEFGAFAHIGFGLDLSAEEKEADFISVRGTKETNGVITKLEKEAVSFIDRVTAMKKLFQTAG